MELAEAEAWLEGLINVERMPDMRAARLDLEAIRGLLARVDHPERGLPVLHVAGSKGKGSTALLSEALLREVGCSVGTFTSPHLVRWTERFRLNGREVDADALAKVLSRLRPEVDAMLEGPNAPSFFDATTAAGFLLFAEAGVDVAVLEVGLGGRLDSTNACEPIVTAVTSIELEHTDRLGETLGEIAGEKVGIAKAGVPLVVGRMAEEPMDVIVNRAAEVGAPLARFGVDFESALLESTAEGSRFRFRDGDFETECTLAALGAHQIDNAAVAWAAVRRGPGLPQVPPAQASRAFAGVVLPGRVEIVERRPTVVVDGAHTPVSAEALAGVLEGIPHGRLHVVLSVSVGKDVDAVCRSLTCAADDVTVTSAEPHRSMEPEALRAVVARVAPQVRVHIEADPYRAVRSARAGLSPDDLLCVAGSVYMAGAARMALGAQ